jgi:apolipoprotein N-acyltransferase
MQSFFRYHLLAKKRIALARLPAKLTENLFSAKLFGKPKLNGNLIWAKLNVRTKEWLALIFGGLLALAFSPLELYPLAIICPALLLLLWLSATPARAFAIGLCFGLGFFAVGVSWVFISIHVFGHTSIFLSLFITALFISILALFFAIQGYLLTWLFPQNNSIKCYIIFPALWAISEWVRSWIFTGFPWILIGTSQIDTSLAGYAPLVGVFGLAFLVTLSSALLLDLLLNGCALFSKSKMLQRFFTHRKYGSPLPHLKQDAEKHFLISLMLLVVIWAGGYGLRFVPWTHNVGKPIEVSLVQANVPQELKWQSDYIQASLKSYLQLTAKHWKSRLIIWPEAAIPLLQHNVLPFLAQLGNIAKQHKTTLITGIPIQQGFQYYNGMIALGVDEATYLKQRLVIFGEYLPWWINWAKGVLNLLDIPMSSFSSGPANQAIFKVANLDLGTFICYEIAYPSLVRRVLPQAEMLLTINDDAWFGHSFALAQHLQIGQFQALASGRYLLFLSNTGMTAIVTPQGKIQSQLPPFQIGVLTGAVHKTLGITPWVQFGDCPSIIFLVGLILICYAFKRKQ